MPDIYGILNMGKSALLTQQKAVDVTGHNIANANTPGYSRQRVNMETTEPISFWPGQMGTGVRAKEVQRIYDRFLGVQINHENQSLGRWEAKKGGLETVELIFDESSGYGLNQALSDFWNAWHDLANNPSGYAERIALVGKSEQLTAKFQKSASDLVAIQKDLDTTITSSLDQVNLIADQIADLNQKIAQEELLGQNANDYRDKRDLLLKDLSEVIDINSFETSDGKVTVLVGGGRPLVENVSSWHLSSAPSASGLHDIVWLDSDGNAVNITSKISDGKLKGWCEVRDEVIPDYVSRLDTLANTLRQEVNNLHAGGFGLDGSTGLDFFTGTSASDLAVNSTLSGNARSIAAAANATGLPGDNSLAISIANLQSQLTMNGGTATFDSYFDSLVTDAGNELQTATKSFDHQSSILTHLDNYRESVSGVSLDEEMVNLIKYQHAYDAAAKLITTVDELLNTLMNMV